MMNMTPRRMRAGCVGVFILALGILALAQKAIAEIQHVGFTFRFHGSVLVVSGKVELPPEGIGAGSYPVDVQVVRTTAFKGGLEVVPGTPMYTKSAGGSSLTLQAKRKTNGAVFILEGRKSEDGASYAAIYERDGVWRQEGSTTEGTLRGHFVTAR
ncbi:MAG: hypothetical protein ABII00_01480 [Elusimicrobiota bacterium]